MTDRRPSAVPSGAPAPAGSGTAGIATTLANSGVTAGTYGSASNVPVLTVDAKGRVTSASKSSRFGRNS